MNGALPKKNWSTHKLIYIENTDNMLLDGNVDFLYECELSIVFFRKNTKALKQRDELNWDTFISYV